MDNQEYIIISKTDIETRIEEINVLKKNIIKNMKELYQALNQNAIEYYKYKQNLSYTLSMLTTEGRTLKQILSKSTPLQPVLKNTFDVAQADKSGVKIFGVTFEDHFSNLKLKI